jgi:hypothetical protein
METWFLSTERKIVRGRICFAWITKHIPLYEYLW